jgi:putative spermidine/putrescine transport system permease protein|tara:strand:- start:917 stop:1804 length:888 start_codon:yes stop_codon:yes gene_type:complete
LRKKIRIFQPKLSWLAIPFALIFIAYFVVPLILTLIVSFWDYTEYSIIPDFIFGNYVYIFQGCFSFEDGLCLTFKTYISTFFFCFFTWLITLLLGFSVAYFLAFYVNSLPLQITLFLICTIPFWTSNVIRMVSWIPLLGRNGLVNETLISFGLIQEPIEWLLYSSFSVVLALVHLYTLFMIVPIFNSMLRIDKEVIEAAYDSGANQFQIITNVIIPLCKPGIIIGSIFVITVVMGDFLTIGIMGGQQLASIGKIINTEMNYLQLPGAAANSVILLLITIFIIIVMTKFIDIRKEL